MPVGTLDPLPWYRAEPGVGNKLVGAGKHADRVQLARLIPVLEDVDSQRHQAAHGGNRKSGPEQPPGRPEDQREAARQEAGHDDRHRHPGHRAAMEGMRRLPVATRLLLRDLLLLARVLLPDRAGEAALILRGAAEVALALRGAAVDARLHLVRHAGCSSRAAYPPVPIIVDSALVTRAPGPCRARLTHRLGFTPRLAYHGCIYGVPVSHRAVGLPGKCYPDCGSAANRSPARRSARSANRSASHYR